MSRSSGRDRQRERGGQTSVSPVGGCAYGARRRSPSQARPHMAPTERPRHLTVKSLSPRKGGGQAKRLFSGGGDFPAAFSASRAALVAAAHQRRLSNRSLVKGT